MRHSLDLADLEDVEILGVVPRHFEPVGVVGETAALVGGLQHVYAFLRLLRRVVGGHRQPEARCEVRAHARRLLEADDGRRQHHPHEHEDCRTARGQTTLVIDMSTSTAC